LRNSSTNEVRKKELTGDKGKEEWSGSINPRKTAKEHQRKVMMQAGRVSTYRIGSERQKSKRNVES